MNSRFLSITVTISRSPPQWFARTLACLLLASAPLATLAQSVQPQPLPFPTAPITIVVPFAAGGPTDLVARKLSAELSNSIGQSVNVRNQGGIGGTVGMAAAAQAAPDGYTLLLHHIGMATTPSLYRNLTLDPQRDFEPIGLIVDSPMVLLSAPTIAIGSGRQFGPYVRANQAKLSMAYAGVGSASHLCGLLMASVLRVELFSIPYTGTAPALRDLENSRADLLCDQTTSALNSVRAGKVLAYGVTTAKRLEALPLIPTTLEEGMAGLKVSIWHGLYAPRGTPAAVIEALSRALQSAVASPAFVAAMTQVGAVSVAPRAATPQALRIHLAEQTVKWKPLIQKSAQFAD